MERISPLLFDWSLWRAGTILDVLGIPQRSYSLKANASKLRESAIGWCNAEDLICRPKNGKAVMFCKDDIMFWTHIDNDEFEYIWREITSI